MTAIDLNFEQHLSIIARHDGDVLYIGESSNTATARIWQRLKAIKAQEYKNVDCSQVSHVYVIGIVPQYLHKVYEKFALAICMKNDHKLPDLNREL